MDENTKRARVAYEAFRGGLLPMDADVPRWEDAPNWIRDVAVVAYLQGKLDAASPKKSSVGWMGDVSGTPYGPSDL